MHELSLAEALLEQVRRHVPVGAKLLSIEIEAEAALALEPEAMYFAWQSLTDGTEFHGAKLELTLIPWTLQCKACGRQWQSEQALETCECGQPGHVVQAGSALTLVSLECEQPSELPPQHNSQTGSSQS